MEELAKLPTVTQVFIVIGIAAFACIAVWQFGKTIRGN